MEHGPSGYAQHMLSSPLRVRFAPSPTGELHLGSAMVALANAGLAQAVRSAGGEAVLVLRIDDTDLERSLEHAADTIIDDLEWLGIEWDEGPVYQSRRGDRHGEVVARLLDDGHAYRCFCTSERLEQVRGRQAAAGEPPRYDGHCSTLATSTVTRKLRAGTSSTVRLRVAGHPQAMNDLVRGIVPTPAGSFGDPVIQRADGTPTYLLASVVDDVDLAITLVCRGEDHLPNTGVQIALFAVLEAVPPMFAHLPLLRREDGRKLSKRDPLGTLDELRYAGYSPIAIRRYLAAVLGQGETDLLAAGALPFDLARVPRSAPRVDAAQLDAIGRGVMVARAALPDELIADLAGIDVEVPATAVPLLQDVAGGCASLLDLSRAMRRVLDEPRPVDHDLLGDPRAIDELAAALGATIEQPGWGDDVIGQVKASVRARQGRMGDALRSIRRALTGVEHGPGLGVVLEAIGREAALRRVARVRA